MSAITALSLGITIFALILFVAAYFGRNKVEEHMQNIDRNTREHKQKKPIAVFLENLWGVAPDPNINGLAMISFFIMTGLFALQVNSLIAGILTGMLSFITVPRLLVSWRKSRMKKLFPQQLRPATNIIKTAIKGGANILQAIHYTAESVPDPLGEELRRVVEETNANIPLKKALQNMADRVNLPEARVFAESLALAAEIGTAEALQMISSADNMVREKMVLKEKLDSKTSNVKLGFGVASIIPFALAGILSMAMPMYFDALMTVPGKVLLFLGTVLICFGWYIIIRLCQSAEEQL